MECVYEKYIRDFRCKYYILKTTKGYVGIKIEKINPSGEILEECSVENVDKDERKVRELLRRINKGKVTPITLKDVIADSAI